MLNTASARPSPICGASSRSRSAARARRQLVRKAMGGSPTSSVKRRPTKRSRSVSSIFANVKANVSTTSAIKD